MTLPPDSQELRQQRQRDLYESHGYTPEQAATQVRVDALDEVADWGKLDLSVPREEFFRPDPGGPAVLDNYQALQARMAPPIPKITGIIQ